MGLAKRYQKDASCQAGAPGEHRSAVRHPEPEQEERVGRERSPGGLFLLNNWCDSLACLSERACTNHCGPLAFLLQARIS